jgi:hypothetical protein
MPPTKEIEIAKEEFKSTYDLWNIVNGYKGFQYNTLNDCLSQLENNNTENIFIEFFTKGNRIKKSFDAIAEETGEDMPILVVTKQLSIEMKSFNDEFVPLIKSLGNEAIELEHWEEIRDLTEVDMTNYNKDEITLSHIKDIDVKTYDIQLQDISVKAFKQYKICCDLDKMDKQLSERKLVLESYKDNQFFKLTEIDDITTELDDKIQNLYAMKNYPDINEKLKKRALSKCRDLEKFAESIDLWCKFQKNWM